MVPREGWEDVRIGVMEEVQMAKFTQHPELAEKLVATGDAELTYNNECGDTYWGVFNDEGENNLGKVLMRVRARLAEGRPPLEPPSAPPVPGAPLSFPAWSPRAAWATPSESFIPSTKGTFISSIIGVISDGRV